jgi:hypothetical protein
MPKCDLINPFLSGAKKFSPRIYLSMISFNPRVLYNLLG